jgi:VCBS repeat protein
MALSSHDLSVVGAALLSGIVGCAESAPIPGFEPPAFLAADERAPALDFLITPTLAIPGPTTAITVADVDGDGHPDLVTLGPSFGVAVLRGKGDGSFGEARVVVDNSRGPLGILTADFNGDGKIDLAIAYPRYVSVLFGRGDGAFDERAGSPTIDAVSAIAAGDLDRDGHVDLVIASSTGTVSVLPGKGGGQLGAPVAYPSIQGVTALLAADFDGDGGLDLLVVSRLQRVTLFSTGGELRAGKITEIDSGVHRTAVAVDDVNHDGRADIESAFYAQEDEWLSVDLGQGPVQAMTFSYWQRPRAMAAADLDGDGKGDLVVGMSRGATVLALFGNGDGTFRNGRYFGLAAAPTAIASADLDGDGKLDLVALTGGIQVLLGEGDGTFRGERAFLVSRDARRVVVGDVDGDGQSDCVVTDADYLDRFTVYLGDGRGYFREGAVTSLGPAYAGAQLALVDLNGDGKLDVVSAHDAVVLLGNGDGTFRPLQKWSDVAARELALGDFDGDGQVDLVLVAPGSRSAPLLRGKRDGSFEAASTVDVGGALAGAAAADLDGDGKLDLAVATDAGLDVLFGQGDGHFEAPRHVIKGTASKALTVGDFNGDGRPDVAVAPASSEDLSVLLNVGGRAFAAPANVVAGPGVARLTATDIDGDGAPDLIAQGSSFTFLVGNGDGTFQAPRTFGVEGRDLAIADVDGDGRHDLLILQRSNRFLRLLLNATPRR